MRRGEVAGVMRFGRSILNQPHSTFTTGEMAELLGYHPRTIRRWKTRGLLGDGVVCENPCWKHVIGVEVLETLFDTERHATPAMFINLCRHLYVGECSTRHLLTYLCLLHPEITAGIPPHLLKETT